MLHTLALIARRADHSRDAFRAHYEEIHVPLAISLLPWIRYYVRNHVAESLDADEPGFDVLTEFGVPEPADAKRVMDLLSSEEGEPILRDEQSFMDRPRNAFFSLLPRTRVQRVVDRSKLEKIAVLASRPDGTSRDAFLEKHWPETEARFENAAGFAHWETRPAQGEPEYDAVSFAWFEPGRFDPATLRAWHPNVARLRRLRVVEHPTHFEGE